MTHVFHIRTACTWLLGSVLTASRSTIRLSCCNSTQKGHVPKNREIIAINEEASDLPPSDNDQRQWNNSQRNEIDNERPYAGAPAANQWTGEEASSTHENTKRNLETSSFVTVSKSFKWSSKLHSSLSSHSWGCNVNFSQHRWDGVEENNAHTTKKMRRQELAAP